MKTIIIEDEQLSQEVLYELINEYCPNLEFCGFASNIEESKSLINEVNPDLVFMDIQLGDEISFDLLESVKNHEFKVIFTTAYQEYAFRAFKYEAVDYLLKPYSPKDLIKAVQKIKKQHFDPKLLKRLSSLLKDENITGHSGKISISTAEGISIIEKEKIIRVEADGSYSTIFSVNDNKLICSKSLKEIENLLQGNPFFRTHTSHLINLNHVKQYIKEDGGFISMSNEDEVPLSRRRKHEFLDLLNKINSV